MTAEIIDFTTEALNRRWERHYELGETDHCSALSALIEGYLDGAFKVTWRDGEPFFEATSLAALSDANPWSVPEVRDLLDALQGASDEE
jgi:hypothetical protein